MPELFKCPMDCPNRESDIGKGYSYMFSILLTSLLVWQSVDVKYSKANDWELKTKEVPIALLIPCLFLIAGALGINTDPIARTRKVTAILDKGQPQTFMDKLAKSVVDYMHSKNFVVFEGANQYNTVYLEGSNVDGSLNSDQPNHFNDRRLVI